MTPNPLSSGRIDSLLPVHRTRCCDGDVVEIFPPCVVCIDSIAHEHIVYRALWAQDVFHRPSYFPGAATVGTTNLRAQIFR